MTKSRRLVGVVVALATAPTALLGATIAVGEASAKPIGPTPAHLTPTTGAKFNNPTGTEAQQYRLLDYVNRAIDSTPAGRVIRIAVFSMSEGRTADKLIAAYHRGVDVKVVFDDSKLFNAQRRLISVLGTNRKADSFVVVCDDSCRGSTGGNMHDKFFLFSRVGNATQVVMTGSNNITRFNARNQWADVFTSVGNLKLYRTFVHVFQQLKQDRAVEPSFISKRVGRYVADFFPYVEVTRADDPLVKAMDPIRCFESEPDPPTKLDPEAPPLVPPPGERRTRVHISMHAWHSPLGVYLARRTGDLVRRGCVVRVIMGVGGGARVQNILANTGVPVFYGTKRNNKGRILTHQKVLTVNGVYGSEKKKVVFTGSHNWSSDSRRHDDLLLRIVDDAIYDLYSHNFRRILRDG